MVQYLYAAFTLNIPRYQMTAMPVLALSTGLAVTILLQGWRGGPQPPSGG